jgi:hypothetical protein
MNQGATMNPLEKITDNAVVGFGILGAFAGHLMGGSAKERTNQAVLYASLGAAAGFFFNRSKEQRTKALVAASQAQSKAIQAVELASEAQQIAATPVATKTKVLGNMETGQFLTGVALF